MHNFRIGTQKSQIEMQKGITQFLQASSMHYSAIPDSDSISVYNIGSSSASKYVNDLEGLNFNGTPPPLELKETKDEYLIATQDRNARNDLSQLSFRRDGIIRVFQKNSDSLWRGKNQGRQGFFPSNLCDPAEGQDAFLISGSTTPTAQSYSQPDSQSSTQENGRNRSFEFISGGLAN